MRHEDAFLDADAAHGETPDGLPVLDRELLQDAVLGEDHIASAVLVAAESPAQPVWSFEDKTEAHDALLVNVDAAWQDDRKLGSISLALPRRHDKRPYAALVSAAQAVTN